MPTTDTNIPKVIVNKLTQAQYNSATKNPNEFYAVTDIDMATEDYVDNRIKTNTGAPTTSTVGTVGQLLEDTTNGKLYICTAVNSGNPTTYTWVEAGEKQIEVVTMSGFTFSPFFPYLPDYDDFDVASYAQNVSKTFNEILALLQAGKRVVAKVTIDAGEVTTPIIYEGDYYVDLNLDASDTGDEVIIGSMQMMSTSGAIVPNPVTMFIMIDSLDEAMVIAVDYNGIQMYWNDRILYEGNSTPPATSSSEPNNLGQLYRNKSTGKNYALTSYSPRGTTPETYSLNWQELSVGGDEIEVVNVAANIHVTGTIISTDWTEDDQYYMGRPNRAYINNLTADKTYAEILALINAGKKVYAKVNLAAFMASGSGNFPWIAFPGDYYVELTTNDTTDSGIIGSIKIENIAETATLSVIIALDNGNTIANLTLDSDFLWAWGLYSLNESVLNARLTNYQGAPTTSSVGTKGALWEDATNGELYICTAVSGNTYTWEKLVRSSEVPVFTMTTTDPGEGQPLAANNFIAVYAA